MASLSIPTPKIWHTFPLFGWDHNKRNPYETIMSLARAVFFMRQPDPEDRFDVALPYGNRLVFLRRQACLSVRLLLIIDGIKTFVTPRLPISRRELERLLAGMYAEVDLGAIKLSTEPRELLISFEFRLIPVPNSIWKPVVQRALG